MNFFSPDFENGGEIPIKFTCNGQGVRPSLFWSEVPAEAKSLAISVTDPDAPSGNYIHWQVVNIPTSATKLESSESVVGNQIINSSGDIEFVPPCPGSGKHRYVFALLALDIEKMEPNGLTDIIAELKSNIIEKAEFFATYEQRE